VGDDIVLYTDASRAKELTRLHTLRQQKENQAAKPQLALSDFVAPRESGLVDYVGAFAVTTGHGAQELAERFEKDYDPYNAIMAKALADRLAEAFAEYLHKRARTDWGYGKSENLSNADLIGEKYQGRRPVIRRAPTTRRREFCSICSKWKKRPASPSRKTSPCCRPPQSAVSISPIENPAILP
jgi:5-methyltetrahydrofolate--homocysteine methyltransferase